MDSGSSKLLAILFLALAGYALYLHTKGRLVTTFDALMGITPASEAATSTATAPVDGTQGSLTPSAGSTVAPGGDAPASPTTGTGGLPNPVGPSTGIPNAGSTVVPIN